MTVVSNTSPITNLAAVNQLNLLQQLYGNIIIPEAVFQELTGINNLLAEMKCKHLNGYRQDRSSIVTK